MQLSRKKDLAARTLKVGRDRIMFNTKRLDEIKEAITKQDIRDLKGDKAIIVKPILGTRKQVKRKTRLRGGSVKKNVNTRKRDYMTITRKLRAFVAELRDKKILTSEEYWKLRKEIRTKAFKSKSHFKERVNQIIKGRSD